MLQEFIDYLLGEVKNHSIYVWGGQGQSPTAEWIKQKETNVTYRKKALALYEKNVALGYDNMKAFDCSGLGMYWLQNIKKLSTDMTANGMKAKCQLVTKDALRKGDWVFRCYTSGANKGKAYHIGYVVDDNLNVIEAKGRAYGVIQTVFDSDYWNAYGRPSYFADEIEADDSTAYTFTRILRRGNKGEDVKALQKLLNNAGDYGLAVDGQYGTKTYNAVRSFQKEKGLTVDGVAGEKTIRALGGGWYVEPLQSVDFGTFNVKRAAYKKATPAKIANIVKTVEITGVQEITPKTAKIIAEKAGMYAYMCETISGYGHCVFSKYAASEEKIITMKKVSGESSETRKVIRLMIRGIAFYGCHFDYHEKTCNAQLAQLADILKAETCEKVIVVGDFNRQDFEPITALGYEQTNCGQDICNTDGGIAPMYAGMIDNIFLKGVTLEEMWKEEARDKQLSDHDGLFGKGKTK